MFEFKLYFKLVDFIFVLIKSYFYNDDTFNFNYGQSQAAVGSFKDAEQVN